MCCVYLGFNFGVHILLSSRLTQAQDQQNAEQNVHVYAVDEVAKVKSWYCHEEDTEKRKKQITEKIRKINSYGTEKETHTRFTNLRVLVCVTVNSTRKL